MWGGFSALVRMGGGIVSVILAVHLLGSSVYGYFSLFVSLNMTWLTLNSGFFTSVTRHLVFAYSQHSEQKNTSVVREASYLYVMLVAGLVLLATLLFGNSAVVLIDGKGGSVGQEELKSVFWLIVLAHLMRLWTTSNVSFIEGAGRFDVAARGQMLSPIIVLIYLLWCGFAKGTLSLNHLAWAHLLASLIESVVMYVLARSIVLSNGKIIGRSNAWRMLSTLFQDGLRFQGAGLASMLVDPLNKIVLNHYLGPATVTAYELAVRTVNSVNTLFAAAFRGFMLLAPEPEIARDQYLKTVSQLFLPAVLLYAMAGTTLAALIFSRYLDNGHNVIWLYLVMLPCGLAISLVAPLYHVLVARGQGAYILGLHLRLAVINVILSVVLVRFFGFMGAGIGALLATLYNAHSVHKRFNTTVAKVERMGELFIRQLWPVLAVVTISLAGGASMMAFPDWVLVIGVLLLSAGTVNLFKLPVSAKIIEFFYKKRK